MKKRKKNPDAIDLAIIRELQEDARRPFKSIAAKLDVSESTISNRVNRLVDSGILKLEARVDPFSFPGKVAAIIGVNLKRREHEAALRQIEKLPGVTATWNTTGKYDLFVEVMLDSVEHLHRFLFSSGFEKIPSITATESFILLNSRTKFFKLC